LTTTEKQALREPVLKPIEYSGENVSWQSGKDFRAAMGKLASRRGTESPGCDSGLSIRPAAMRRDCLLAYIFVAHL
jgi:hypothetical protein